MALKARLFISLTAAVVVFPFALSACGDEVTEEHITQVVEEKILVVSYVAELPDCSSENEGRQALVKGENTPRICIDDRWLSLSVGSSKENDFSCKAEKLSDGSGLKIICNGDSIGIVLNGVKGDTGEQGVQGLKGDKGDQGEQGLQGEKGDKGNQGEQGLQGEKGDKGDQGEQGIQGEKGDKGERGLQGEKGDKGDQGEQGIQGEKGDKGENCSVNREGNVISINCGENSVVFDIDEIRGLCPVANEGLVIRKHISNYQDSVYSCKNGFWESSLELTYGTLIDERDNKTYKTVVIGTQTWMAENLNYYDSIVYPGIQGRSICDSCAKYGRHYTAAAAFDSAGTFSTSAVAYGSECSKCRLTSPVRGICPEGWHIPSFSEWKILYAYVGNTPHALQAKEVGWIDATDAFGFAALPAGCMRKTVSGGIAVSGNICTQIWSYPEPEYHSADIPYFAEIEEYHEKTFFGYGVQGDWKELSSVRCLKDE